MVKRNLQISLGTLLLAILIVGASASVQHKWGPWVKGLTVQEPGRDFSYAWFSEDNSKILGFISSGKSARSARETVVWESTSGRELCRVPEVGSYFIEPANILAAAPPMISPPAGERRWKFYDVNSGKCLLGERDQIENLCTSKDDSRLVLFFVDRAPEVWKTKPLQRHCTLAGAGKGAPEYDPRISRTGRRIFFNFQLWDCDTGKLIRKFESDPDFRIEFAPNEQFAVVGRFVQRGNRRRKSRSSTLGMGRR
jgi:hypothetical protein